VLACLEKDPSARPQTADVVAAVLDDMTTHPWTQDDARQWWQQHWPPAQDNPESAVAVSSKRDG
jgi:hypothetical protein